MDSFFKQRFNASKCKTLLKLSIPRIKLLRNRREIQLKQMRRDIAKLLETGQEATARIRVEHIIREEKMMAAQEIVELFCELVSVRLPIIEAQRECPLDLKEAISSICFAAPRCADLPELLQVQLLFAGKYGKEFVAAATELMPECGVNRQLIELLSIRAPAPDVKMKLLKEIAEEHELDWDPSPSEKELLKPHEDLLNGPTQFESGSKFPFPNAKVDEKITSPQPATQEQMNGQTQFVSSSKVPFLNEKVDEAISTSQPAKQEHSDSDEDFDIVDFPEVPKQPLHFNKGTASAPEMLPFPASAFSDDEDQEERNEFEVDEKLSELRPEHLEHKKSITTEDLSKTPAGPVEAKQFVPFMSPPSHSLESSSTREEQNSRPSASIMKFDNLDLQDVLAAAQAAADSAERAATAARTAASLAQLRISELVNKNNDETSGSIVENPFHVSGSESDVGGRAGVDKQHSFSDSGSPLTPASDQNENHSHIQPTVYPSYDDSSPHGNHGLNSHHQPQRLPSMDDEYFSYPNLFNSQGSNLSRPGSFNDPK